MPVAQDGYPVANLEDLIQAVADIDNPDAPFSQKADDAEKALDIGFGRQDGALCHGNTQERLARGPLHALPGRVPGALQGLDKARTVERHGADQVKVWRRSYDIPPPALDLGVAARLRVDLLGPEVLDDRHGPLAENIFLKDIRQARLRIDGKEQHPLALEVRDLHRLAVDQQIGEPEIAMDEAEARKELGL